MARHNQERCDHCRKWVKEGSLVNLEGLTSEEMDECSVDFAVCDKCADAQKSSEEWDKWIKGQLSKGQNG